MSSNLWNAHEHVIPASHIRGYRRGIRDETKDHLRLAVKQYVPTTRSEAQHGDVTLILAPGVGALKEYFEPFFDELLKRYPLIRGVWGFDVVHHGASFLLNENVVGDEPHWFDGSRDMLQMINVFQDQMPPPIVGIGHSWGCVAITVASIFHPRLFTGIVSIEPTFGLRFKTGPHRDHLSVLLAKRRDTWSSREEARSKLLATRFYKSWDPRVFDCFMKYGLRDVPLPESASTETLAKQVTLTMPKSAEVYTMMRAAPPVAGYPQEPDYASQHNQMVIPGFYRGEKTQIYRWLPDVLPPTLYVFGTKSYLASSTYSGEVLKSTGIGDYGGGGIPSGQVQEAFVQDCNHNAPLEHPGRTVETVLPWLQDVLSGWREEMKAREHQPKFERTIHPEWMRRIAKL